MMSLLPLLAEAAHSVAMFKHGITVAMKAVELLNQGQAAVIAFDQPIYGLAKEIQWRYPDTVGEDNLVAMLGGLVIELAVLKAIGSWLLGSGWTEAIAQAGITTTGRAESLVTSTHITRTRYVHQVTASSTEALQELLRKIREERASCVQMLKPQFCSWNTARKVFLP